MKRFVWNMGPWRKDAWLYFPLNTKAASQRSTIFWPSTILPPSVLYAMNPRNNNKNASWSKILKKNKQNNFALLHILETFSNLATDPMGYFLEAELSKTEIVTLLWAWRYDMDISRVKYEP